MHTKFAVYGRTGELLHEGLSLALTSALLNLVPHGYAEHNLAECGKSSGHGYTAISWKLTNGPMVNLACAYAAEGIVRVGTSD